jgi:hypothetical protein
MSNSEKQPRILHCVQDDSAVGGRMFIPLCWREPETWGTYFIPQELATMVAS